MGKRRRIIDITWRDSAQFTGWHNDITEKDCSVAICRTVGQFIGEDASKVLVALNTADNGDVGHMISIPKENITRRRWVKEK